jgi:transglutaminase-like putative cysteine protease
MRRVRAGAVYNETPPVHALPLESFLFTDREGYCQQFSGAMALLLRMGGVPARVAAGFAPGGYDQRLREYVVRDFDAHSWVEAYFPRYGWVPFDPTPSIAPPRSQAGDEDVSAATGDQRDTGGVRTRAEDLTGQAPSATDHTAAAGWTLPAAALAVVALLLAVAAVRAWRLRTAAAPAPADVAELVRALRRTGRAPDAPLTLARLERLLDGDGGYVRALRERRYGGRGAGPTRAQRRALRRCLAAGLGLGGRLRAWWALPPRLP